MLAGIAKLLCAASRLSKLRKQCIETLKTMRMPTNRTESYRFTDVAPIIAQTFEVRAVAIRHAAAPLLHHIFAHGSINFCDSSQLEPSDILMCIISEPRVFSNMTLVSESHERGASLCHHV